MIGMIMFKIRSRYIIAVCCTVVFCTAIFMGNKWYQNTKTMLIVGDSIGEGAGSSELELKWYKKLVPYMKSQFGINLEITNVSMGGNTSYAGYVRTMNLDDKDSYDYVIVCYGQNDKTEDFSLYYEVLLRTIRKKYPEAILLCILESSQREYTDKIQTIQELCKYYDGHVVDTIEAFNNSGFTYDELCDDGTHPNDRGQKVYFEAVTKILNRYYQEVPSTTIEDIKEINKEVKTFERFQYIPKSKLQKVNNLKYRLKVNELSGRLGIDYITVKGNHNLKIYTGDQKLAEKDFQWDNEFTLRYIEVLKDGFYAKEEIIFEFSSHEILENIEGFIMTSYYK